MENKEKVEMNDNTIFLNLIHFIHLNKIDSFVNYFLTYPDFDLNYLNSDSFFTGLLGFSIFMKREKLALFLIKNNCDVNLEDKLGLTPINWASTKINYDKSGFNPPNNSDEELTKVVIALISKGANIVHKNQLNNMFPHREAHLHNYMNIYQIIMNRIKFINDHPEDYQEQYKIILDWMTNVEDFDTCPKQPANIIDACYQQDEKKALEFLENDPKCIELIDDLEQNALHYAIAHQMYSLIRKLILMGINTTKKNATNLTPIDLAFTLGKDSQKMFDFLSNCITKKDKLLVEQKKEQELTEKRLKIQHDLEEKEKLKKEHDEKIKEAQKIKKEKDKLKKLKKKQKKIDDKNESHELKLMHDEDERFHDLELKKLQQIQYRNEMLQRQKEYQLYLENSFLFNCENKSTFWNQTSISSY